MSDPGSASSDESDDLFEDEDHSEGENQPPRRRRRQYVPPPPEEPKEQDDREFCEFRFYLQSKEPTSQFRFKYPTYRDELIRRTLRALRFTMDLETTEKLRDWAIRESHLQTVYIPPIYRPRNNPRPVDFGPYLDLTSTVDQLYNALWEVEYCRTIFALEDYYFKDTLYCDFWEYPDHLGYTWHLNKSSVEICAIAKDFHQKILRALPTFQRPVVTNWVIQHQIDELHSEIPGSIRPGRLLVSASLSIFVTEPLNNDRLFCLHA